MQLINSYTNIFSHAQNIINVIIAPLQVAKLEDWNVAAVLRFSLYPTISTAELRKIMTFPYSRSASREMNLEYPQHGTES
jgi:hypothetical protein